MVLKLCAGGKAGSSPDLQVSLTHLDGLPTLLNGAPSCRRSSTSHPMAPVRPHYLLAKIGRRPHRPEAESAERLDISGHWG
jgi:hypothetical protein